MPARASCAGPLGRDGQSEQLARQADRVVADVDHLLHLAEAFLQDLAGLQRHEQAEVGLVLAQQQAPAAQQLATPGRGPGRPVARWRRAIRCTDASISACEVCATLASREPSIGVRLCSRSAGPSAAGSSTPRRARMAATCACSAGFMPAPIRANRPRRRSRNGCHEVWQGHLFLGDESCLRQPARGDQIERGADGRGGGELDRAQAPAADLGPQDARRMGLLQQPPGAPAGAGADHDHVLLGGGNGGSRMSLSRGRTLAQAQLVDQQPQDRAMAGIAHRLVVDVAGVPGQRASAYRARPRC